MIGFDDYLGLRRRDFSRAELVVFTGRSGSGKSTAIRFLLEHHPDFRDREQLHLGAAPFTVPARRWDVIAVDDLTAPRELGAIVRLLRSSRTLLVASHLAPALLRPLQLVARSSFFRTDADTAKVARHLARLGVTATSEAVARYVALFGATYTDVEIILERYPEPTFDRALARFSRFCRVASRARPRPPGPVFFRDRDRWFRHVLCGYLHR